MSGNAAFHWPAIEFATKVPARGADGSVSLSSAAVSLDHFNYLLRPGVDIWSLPLRSLEPSCRRPRYRVVLWDESDSTD